MHGLALLCALTLEEAGDRDLNERVRVKVEGLIEGIELTLREGRAGPSEDLDVGILSFLKRFLLLLKP